MRTFYRQAVMAVPARFEPTNEAEHATVSERVVDMISDAIATGVVAEFGPTATPVIELAVTCNLDQITAHPYPPDCDDNDCPTCQGPRHFARRYITEHPGKHVAIALITIDVP